MTDDMRRLLGGYATGTLTEAERQALFEASLHDQQLFEALADEEALRDLLDDAAARASLLRATESARFTVAGGLREWFERPRAKILVAAGAVLLVVIGYRATTEKPSVEFARVQAPAGQPDALFRTREVPAHDARAAAAPPRVAKPVSGRTATQQAASAPSAPAAAPPVEKSAAGAPGKAKTAPEQRPAPAIRYAVLRRSASGEYVPVPEDYLFAPEDDIRLRVEAARSGFVSVSDEARRVLFASAVTPGAAVVIPQALSVTGRDRALDVTFSENPLVPPSEAQTLRSEFRANDERESLASREPGMSAAPSRLDRISSPRPSGITLRVVLRHRP